MEQNTNLDSNSTFMPFLLMTLNKIHKLSKCLSFCLSNAKSNGPFSTWWLQSLWTAGDKISVFSADGTELQASGTPPGLSLCQWHQVPGEWAEEIKNTGHRPGVPAAYQRTDCRRKDASIVETEAESLRPWRNPCSVNWAAQLTSQSAESRSKAYLQNPIGPTLPTIRKGQ